MRITFEQVSYSYSQSSHKKKSKKRNKKQQPTNASNDISQDATSSHSPGQAAWGSHPHASFALSDISFTLEEGEFLGIAGHTGSGKSTLIQHVNGLIQPTFGRVLVDEHDLSDKAVAQTYRGKVGLVFQYPEHQLFATTVAEDVAFGPRNLKLNEEEVNSRVRAALKSVDLDPDIVGDKNPFELSGGQQRRVAFAGVLSMNPSVLVLDEPVAGLDPIARKEFLELIAQLHAGGLSIIMVSHSMEDLALLSDRILILNKGHQFDLGSPTKVFTRGEELRAIGLDVPVAQKLAIELRDEGFDLDRPLYDTTSLANDIMQCLISLENEESKPAVEAIRLDKNVHHRASSEESHHA